MTAAEDIVDAQVRHQVYLQRYSTQTVNKIIAMLARMEVRLAARLAKTDITDLNARRLKSMMDSVREINVQAHSAINKELRADLIELANYEAGFQTRIIGKALPLEWDLVTPAAAQLRSAVVAKPFQGRLLKDWFRDLEANGFKRVRSEIRMGFSEGRTTDSIVRALRGTRANNYRDGILSISRRGAEATVRTAISHTANVARQETYEANEDLIKGWQFVATLDGRTSDICQALDGTVHDVGKGPQPPRHINCRSTTTPVLKSWKELGINLKEAPEGTRASMNGQVPASETYQTWLKKQSAEFQDETLGKTKGALFRRGDVPLDRFVDKSGHSYTLDELRRRESGAFEEAKV